MKTRYSALVLVKKNAVDEIEQKIKRKNQELFEAKQELQEAYALLQTLQIPTSGVISQIQATKLLFQVQQNQIKEKQYQVNEKEKQLQQLNQQLQKDMIEYEKVKYLELEEIKKRVKEMKLKESKALDEIALLTFNRKKGL